MKHVGYEIRKTESQDATKSGWWEVRMSGSQRVRKSGSKF